MGKCGFICTRLDSSGECDEMGGQCIGDACELWEQCWTCHMADECDSGSRQQRDRLTELGI